MTAGIAVENRTERLPGLTAQGDEDWEQDAWEKDDAPEWAEKEDWDDEDDDDEEEEEEDSDGEE